MKCWVFVTLRDILDYYCKVLNDASKLFSLRNWRISLMISEEFT